MVYEKLKRRVLPQLIPPHSRVLVAVSGGPDSMALAHVLKRYADEEPGRGVSLVITHVNHGVRAESEAEEELVRQTAKAWGIPCVVHRFDAKAYAESVGKSFQEAAREWRYAKWQEDMANWQCNLLATAHHLGDQAETVLYRLLRGSGPSGLAGIYPRQHHLIRPLLGVDKEEILAYCHRHGINYALDRSNEEASYARNKIRLELIPELKRYNKNIVQALGRTAEILRWDEEYLAAQVEDRWPLYVISQSEERVVLDRQVFQEPMAILSRILRKGIALINKEPRGVDFEFIERIIEAQDHRDWQHDLPGAKVVLRERELVFQQPGLAFEPVSLPHLEGVEKEISLNEWTSIPELHLRVGLFEGEADGRPDVADFMETMRLSADFVCGLKEPLVCRTRRPGDKMYCAGVGHKSLKKIFQEEKIPVPKRAFIPVIASGNLVLWIIGVRQCVGALPRHNEKAFLLCVQKLS